jgi:hypothetical protein
MLKVLSIFLKEYMQEEFEDTKGVIRIRKSLHKNSYYWLQEI